MGKLVLRKILKELNTILRVNIFLNNKNNFIFNLDNRCIQYILLHLAGWQSGYAAACKAVNSGSIPDSASIIVKLKYLNKGSSLYK